MDRPALEALASEWLVYGDSLQQAGDPRGELATLSHAVDEGRTEETIREAYVREHGVQLLGGAKRFLDSYKLEWRFCEIVAAEVHIKQGDDPQILVRELLDAPCSSLLSQLAIVAHPEPGQPIDLAPAMKTIEREDRIRGLAIVDDRAAKASMLVSRDFEPDRNLVGLGSFTAFWSRLERLRLVVADSQQLELGKIDAPELRSFVLHNLRYGDGWGGEASPLSTTLAEASWPKLADFEMRLTETWMANVPDEQAPYVPIYSADDYDGNDEFDDGDCDSVNWNELAGLFANLAKCPLRRLVLTSFVGGQSVIRTLGETGLAPTLVELDLSHSELADDDLDVLFEHQAAFAHVKRMVLDGTHVTTEGMTRLRGLGMEVVKDDSAEGSKHRYVVGQE